MNNKEIFIDVFNSKHESAGIKHVEVKNLIKKILIKKFKIKDSDVNKFCTDTNKNKGTYYFHSTDNKIFTPVIKKSPKNYTDSINIDTIMNNLDPKNPGEPESSKVFLLAYLFDYELSLKEIHYLNTKRLFLDEKEIRKIASKITQTEQREDVLLKLIDILSNSSCSKISIITNDIHFVLNIITSIILYLDKDKNNELWLLFDPASVTDVLSFRLYLLVKFGVKVKILPIKNKYPYFGIAPNWTPNDGNVNLPEYFYNFKTFFFEKQSGDFYFKLIEDSSKIKKIISAILENDLKIEKYKSVSLNEKNDNKIKFKIVPNDDYLLYLSSIFNKSTDLNGNERNDIAYRNANFKFKTIEIDKIYSRSKNVTLYKIVQAYYFINHFKNKYFIFSNKDTTVTFIPFSIENISRDNYFPINPPFIEENQNKDDRLEVGEGHSRIWVLYNIMGVKRINTIVVSNIHEKYLRKKEGFKDFTSNLWNQTNFPVREIDDNISENYLLPRNIESYTHILPDNIFKELFEKLQALGILETEDKVFSKKLN